MLSLSPLLFRPQCPRQAGCGSASAIGALQAALLPVAWTGGREREKERERLLSAGIRYSQRAIAFSCYSAGHTLALTLYAQP